MSDLKLHEQQIRDLFDLASDIVVVSTLCDSRIVAVNRVFRELTGWGNEKALGYTPVQLGLWKTAESRDVYLSRLREFGFVENHAVDLVGSDGKDWKAVISARVIDIGEVQYVVAFVRDISGVVEIKKDLVALEERLLRMFEQSPLPMAYMHRDNTFQTFYNKAWFDAFGFDAAKDQGKTGVELGIWINPNERTEIFERALRGEETIAREVEMQRADGRRCWISYTARMANTEDRRLWWVTYLDITARKMALKKS